MRRRELEGEHASATAQSEPRDWHRQIRRADSHGSVEFLAISEMYFRAVPIFFFRKPGNLLVVGAERVGSLTGKLGRE